MIDQDNEKWKHFPEWDNLVFFSTDKWHVEFYHNSLNIHRKCSADEKMELEAKFVAVKQKTASMQGMFSKPEEFAAYLEKILSNEEKFIASRQWDLPMRPLTLREKKLIAEKLKEILNDVGFD